MLGNRLQRKSGEQGSIIIIALILLMLVTLMGVSMTQNTAIEIQVAGNDRDYKQNFYLAEAAAMEAVQRMDNAAGEDLKPATTTLGWVYDDTTDLSDKATMAANGAVSAVDANNNTRYGAVARGVTGGSSLSMTGTSQLYTFDAYGYSADRGRSHIMVGYKRRF